MGFSSDLGDSPLKLGAAILASEMKPAPNQCAFSVVEQYQLRHLQSNASGANQSNVLGRRPIAAYPIGSSYIVGVSYSSASHADAEELVSRTFTLVSHIHTVCGGV